MRSINKKTYRPTWAEVDLSAVKDNLAAVKGLIAREVNIMAVVKADAYGHGILPISRVLCQQGVDYLGVATVDEALAIRKGGINAPVLVLGSVLAREAAAAMSHGITLTLADAYLLETVRDLARSMGIVQKVHIKVDTGMGRLGPWHEEALELIKRSDEAEEIETEGVYSHFSSAGRDRMITEKQMQSFAGVLRKIDELGIEVKYRHISNSIAVGDWEKAHFNLVRPGIMLYGVYPKQDFRQLLRLRPGMSLKTKVVFLKDVPAGRAVSYGRTYITQKPTRIATLPIGYADGYGRILSNRAHALVKGEKARVVGMVTMDQTMLDVGHIDDVRIGEEVVLIGAQGDSQISVESVSKEAGTIPYEVLSAITKRVPRVYIGD